MDPVFVPSIIVMGGLGFLFGAGLAYASRQFAVKVDPKVEQIFEILPHVNCGACGQAGCNAYADAVAAGRVPPNQCTPGGRDIIAKISFIMGLTGVQSEEPKVAVVQCQGGHEQAVEKFIYEGIQDCHAALLIGGGHKACRYGCLGLASCVHACPFDAMVMNANGLPEVIEAKCTGCNVCVVTCPRNIMAMIPRDQKVFLGCISQDRAKDVKSVCSVGCWACKICVSPKVVPTGTIVMNGNLPVIKDVTSEQVYTAAEKCPALSYVVRIAKPDMVANKPVLEQIIEG
jgi:Na+-translocating ferredoxin:NAD+ oxidoreductase subunit B